MYDFIDIICGTRCTTAKDEEASPKAQKSSSEEIKPTVQNNDDDKPSTSQESVTNDAVTNTAVETVDPMDTKNYLVVQLTKPMGILFEENIKNKCGGAFIAKINEGHSAAEDGSIHVGDQLVAVGVERVSGMDFGDVVQVIEKNEVNIKLILFRGSAENLYGPSGATIEWLDAFIAERGREDPVAAEEQELQEDGDESIDKQDLQQDDTDKSPEATNVDDADNAKEVDKFDEVTAAVRDVINKINNNAQDSEAVESKEEEAQEETEVTVDENTAETIEEENNDADSNQEEEADVDNKTDSTLVGDESETDDKIESNADSNSVNEAGISEEEDLVIVENDAANTDIDGDDKDDQENNSDATNTNEDFTIVDNECADEKSTEQVIAEQSEVGEDVAKDSEEDHSHSVTDVNVNDEDNDEDNECEDEKTTEQVIAEQSEVGEDVAKDSEENHSVTDVNVNNNDEDKDKDNDEDNECVDEKAINQVDECDDATDAEEGITKNSKEINLIRDVKDGGVVITEINFDSKAERSASNEYVEIVNKSESDMDVSGYSVEDTDATGKVEATFSFPANTVLKAGESTKIYTNEYHPESGGHSFGSGCGAGNDFGAIIVWNNVGGVAVLKNADGDIIHEYRYEVCTQKTKQESKPVQVIKKADKGDIIIFHINFDGQVEGTESDEYVEIANISESDVDVSGCIVEDINKDGKVDHTFEFSAATPVLKAGESLKIYTNEYHEESGGHSFKSGRAIWNNAGGVGVLKNADGAKIHEYTYEGEEESDPVQVIKKADKGDIIIFHINYDGQAKRTESDEYVEIANISELDVDISGCIVEDINKDGKVDHTFEFPTASPVLKAGESVKIYTNEYHEESGGHSFKSGRAVWNNAGGVGVLKNADGAKIHEYTYEPDLGIKKADKGDIIIFHINYDGQVKRTESDEYVEIANISESDVDVSGCIVEDINKDGKVDHTFEFPAATPVLKAGESLKIYTNEYHEESGGHSFKSGSAIWNNAGGVGVLKNADGDKIHEYTYDCESSLDTTKDEDLAEDTEECCDFGGLVISSINVYGSGKSQSDEYVEIINTLKSSIDISGYSVLDVNANYAEQLSDGESGPTFTFPESTVLQAGESVRIYTNEDHTDSGGYSFGVDKEVWNDLRGEAVLKDADGRKIGQFKYDEGGNATCFYKVLSQPGSVEEKTKSVECVEMSDLKVNDTSNDEDLEKMRGEIAEDEVKTQFSGVVFSSINIYGKKENESDEFVEITNISKSPVDISGYSVEDVNSNYAEQLSDGDKGSKFTFPSDSPLLEAGKSVKIYTSEVHNESGGYSFGSQKGIWFNMNGKAELKNSKGKKIGELSYDEAGNFTSLCYYEVCVKAGNEMNVEKASVDSAVTDEEISEAEVFVTPKSSLEIAPELNETGVESEHKKNSHTIQAENAFVAIERDLGVVEKSGVETDTVLENEDPEEEAGEEADTEAEATYEDVTEEYIGCLDGMDEEEEVEEKEEEENINSSEEAAVAVNDDDSDDFVLFEDAVDKEEPSTSDIPEEPAICEIGEEELLKLD